MFLGLSRSLGLLVTGAVLSIAAVGCSEGRQPKGSMIKGLVTVKGVPAAGLILNFHSANNQVASTTTLPDGRYFLEGVPSGPVTVSMTSISGLPGGGSSMPGSGPGGMKTSNDAPKGAPMDTMAKSPEIPSKYSKAETSTLKYTVDGKEQIIDIIVP